MLRQQKSKHLLPLLAAMGAFGACVCICAVMHLLQALTAVVCSQVNKNELAWSAAPHGPPQLEHKATYKLSEGGFPSLGPTVSPAALSKFLSAVSGKQIQNPPSEMLATRGVFMHDLLELFSGHTIPGRVRLLCTSFPCLSSCPASFALPLE